MLAVVVTNRVRQTLDKIKFKDNQNPLYSQQPTIPKVCKSQYCKQNKNMSSKNQKKKKRYKHIVSRKAGDAYASS